MVVRQKDDPDPPIAAISKIHGSLQWSALFRGRLVTDQLLDRPVIHFTRPQAAKERTATGQKTELAGSPLRHAASPVNEVRITNGDVTYRENAASKPLHITELNVKAENIRNVRSKAHEYPSNIHIEAVVFDKGGSVRRPCRFFCRAHYGGQRRSTLTDIELAELLPLTAQHQVHLSQGRLSATGHVEYAPTVQEVRLRSLRCRT